jgi:hypothetical protein
MSDAPVGGVRVTIAVCALVSAFAVTDAGACGHCLEDRIAAVYNHAVVTAARARHQAVMFLGVTGLDPAEPALAARRMRGAVEATAVATAGSIRVDAGAAAVSFAFDPARASPGRVLEQVRARLARSGCGCDTLRVMRR